MEPREALKTRLMRQAYFMRGSSRDVAAVMRAMGFNVSWMSVEEEWRSRALVDPLFNQARPEIGFPSDDKTSLYQKLVGVAA